MYCDADPKGPLMDGATTLGPPRQQVFRALGQIMRGEASTPPGVSWGAA